MTATVLSNGALHSSLQASRLRSYVLHTSATTLALGIACNGHLILSGEATLGPFSQLWPNLTTELIKQCNLALRTFDTL